jgi:hypothetical protein
MLPVLIAGHIDVVDVDGVVVGDEVVANGVVEVELLFRTRVQNGCSNFSVVVWIWL